MVLEIIRSATTGDDGARGRSTLRAVGSGGVTALVGLVLVVLLAALAALAVPRATAGVDEALGSGSLLWLAIGGARMDLARGSIAFTPLLGTLLLLLLARVGARRGLPPDPPPSLRGAWLVGYAAVGALAVLLGLLSPVRPSPLSLLLPLLLLPGVALTWAHGTAGRGEWIPLSLRRGFAPGAQGALVALAAGMLLVLVATLVHFGRVSHVQADLGAGFFGGLLLVVLQVAALPNLGIWALSLAAGPGFSTTGGAMTTWSSAEAGLLPMVPVLAAQPQPGDLPWVTHLLVLLPIAIGAWIGWRALSRVPRLAATRTKLGVVAWAVVIAAAGVALLDALAGGALGAARLADLGAPALRLSLALVLELGLGALLVLTREWWVLRR